MPVSIAAIRGPSPLPWTVISRGETTRAKSAPAIGGSARTSAIASSSLVAAANTPPRIEPASRMWRTSARVSTSLIAGMPQSTSQSQPAALGARRVLGVHRRAHDHRARPDAIGLHRLLADAVVADVRIGERDDLPGEARVGDRLLIARHAGREDDLAGGRTGRAHRDAVEARAVLEQDVRRGAAAHAGTLSSVDRSRYATAPAATVSSTRPRSVRPGEAAVLRAAFVAALPHDPLGVEVDEHEVRGLAHGDRRDEQVEQAEARRELLDDELERQRAGHDEVGVDRRERRLQPGRAHRRLLERDVLLVAGVRRVVGRDAVDRAAAQTLDERLAVLFGAQRRVHLAARVERAHVLVGHRQVVRARLAGHGDAARLGVRDDLD